MTMKLLDAVPSPTVVVNEGVLQTSESVASISIMIYIVFLLAALALGFWIDRALPRRVARYIPEASAALVLGAVAGAIVNAASSQANERAFLSFHPEFFFLFLLPPIIFESAISMDPGPFFRNFGAISYFAFAGTLLSAIVVGVALFFLGVAHVCFRLTLVESLLFGALISATDPVTVLAIFNQLGVQEDMYALVFGESVLNDAVALVLYRAFKRFLIVPITAHESLLAVGSFLAIVVGSLAIGAGVGIIAALLFRTGVFRGGEESQHGHIIEASMLALFAYVAYMLADGVQMSGIVAVLFCGIVVARYTIHNLSASARETIIGFFKILAKTAETFVFVYIGASMFLLGTDWHEFMLFLATLVLINIARCMHVYPGVAAINAVRAKERAIPSTHKHMLALSGLRGGVAVALAIEMVSDLSGKASARAVMSVTLGIAAFTILFLGGVSHDLVDRFKLRADDSTRGGTRLPMYAELAPTSPRATVDGAEGREPSLHRQHPALHALQVRVHPRRRAPCQELPRLGAAGIGEARVHAQEHPDVQASGGALHPPRTRPAGSKAVHPTVRRVCALQRRRQPRTLHATQHRPIGRLAARTRAPLPVSGASARHRGPRPSAPAAPHRGGAIPRRGWPRSRPQPHPQPRQQPHPQPRP